MGGNEMANTLEKMEISGGYRGLNPRNDGPMYLVYFGYSKREAQTRFNAACKDAVK
jgi:hypothetical protein